MMRRGKLLKNLGKSILRSTHGKCKGPEAGINVAYLRISMKASKVEKDSGIRKGW